MDAEEGDTTTWYAGTREPSSSSREPYRKPKGQHNPPLSPVLDCELNPELLVESEPPPLRLPPVASADELEVVEDEKISWWNCCYRGEVAEELIRWVVSFQGIAHRGAVIIGQGLLQHAAFLAFVVISANDTIVKALSKGPSMGHNGGDFPYAMSSVLLVSNFLSVMVGTTVAWIRGGFPAVQKCWSPRSILKMSPVSMFFGVAGLLKFMSFKFLPPDMISMLAKLNLVMLALTMRFVMGKRYTETQWLVLFLVSGGMIEYVAAREAASKGPVNAATGFPGFILPQLSPGTAIGIAMITLMCVFETLASVFAEKYYKERQHPFYIQKVHVDSTSLVFAAFCFVIEKDIGSSGSASLLSVRGTLMHFNHLFDGWDSRTYLVLACAVAKIWLAGYVSRILDSLVKQLGSCAATALTYLEAVCIMPEDTPWDNRSVRTLCLVLVGIATFATSTRDSVRLRDFENCRFRDYELKESLDASWVKGYQHVKGQGRRLPPSR